MAKKPPAARMPAPEDRVVILHGKELFLRTEYTDHLRKLLRQAHGECEFVKFDGASAQPAEILDECRSFGLMATHKLVVVDDADQLLTQDTRPMFERYCEAPADQATLVLRAPTWRAGNLDKAAAKVGVVIKCDEVPPAQAARWAVRRAERTHGVRLAPDAAAMLIDRTGSDLGRLDGELAKLASAAGEGAAITTALIAELVGLTREEEAWAIQALLLSGDPERALRELRVIMGNGAKDAGVPVSYACCDLARKLVGAAEGMAAGTPPGKLRSALKLWGDSERLVFDNARRLGPARARALFDAAIGVDAGIKSGMDPEIALETLALRFVARP
ncbi:MAG: DNA polymerase III subunit delta [Phycisphaerales bacterium]|nr:DNA polymerase III subunit delta [Planctomycetota bacterium]MCH8509342.1 DNA polymerase III subunit delta [Phycisphaerales bacterium]